MIYNGKPCISFVNQLFPIEKHEISRRRSNLAHLASLAVQNRYRASKWMDRHPYLAILLFYDFLLIFGPRIQKNTENFMKFRYLEGFGDLRKVPGTFRDQKKMKNYEKLQNISKDELLTPSERRDRSILRKNNIFGDFFFNNQSKVKEPMVRHDQSQ